MQSEAECGNPNTNDWSFGEHQFDLAVKWFKAGAGSNIIWNLVLDETGLSTGNWHQCSPVVVNSKTGEITYTPYYYCYKHFSHFVQPGAHRVVSQSSWNDQLVFLNPDGQVVIVLANTDKVDHPVALNIDQKQSDVVTLPAHSFNTFTLPAMVH
jgi:glucosylceramidase